MIIDHNHFEARVIGAKDRLQAGTKVIPMVPVGDDDRNKRILPVRHVSPADSFPCGFYKDLCNTTVGSHKNAPGNTYTGWDYPCRVRSGCEMTRRVCILGGGVSGLRLGTIWSPRQ